MSEEPSGLNETLSQKGERYLRAICMLEPVLSSMIDPVTENFRDTPQVNAIRTDPAFAGLYSTASKELNELGTPNVPVTPKRIIGYMINYSLGGIQECLLNHPELEDKILNYAQAQDIKPQQISLKMSPLSALLQRKPNPSVVDTSQENKPANILDKRLAQATANAPRVLFNQEGNLKQGGVLTQLAFADDYKKFKRTLNDNVGTLRPLAEKVTASKFLESVFANKSHPHHDLLREAILRAANKLPPEKPARAANSLSDQVRARIETAIETQSASR